jgi:copper(I)-binding protein
MVVRLVKGMVLVMLVGLSTFSRAELSLQNGWLRLPPPGVSMLAVYGEIQNQGATARVVAELSMADAASVMVHRSQLEHGKMRMRSAGQLLVPAGGQVTLEPQGLHIMVMQFVGTLVVGENIAIDVQTEAGDRYTLLAEVRPTNAVGPALSVSDGQ